MSCVYHGALGRRRHDRCAGQGEGCGEEAKTTAELTAGQPGLASHRPRAADTSLVNLPISPRGPRHRAAPTSERGDAAAWGLGWRTELGIDDRSIRSPPHVGKQRAIISRPRGLAHQAHDQRQCPESAGGQRTPLSMHAGSGMRNSDGKGAGGCLRACRAIEIPPACCRPPSLSSPNLQGEPLRAVPCPHFVKGKCLQCYDYGQMIPAH